MSTITIDFSYSRPHNLTAGLTVDEMSLACIAYEAICEESFSIEEIMEANPNITIADWQRLLEMIRDEPNTSDATLDIEEHLASMTGTPQQPSVSVPLRVCPVSLRH
jgi:hypothetical protein